MEVNNLGREIIISKFFNQWFWLCWFWFWFPYFPPSSVIIEVHVVFFFFILCFKWLKYGSKTFLIFFLVHLTFGFLLYLATSNMVIAHWGKNTIALNNYYNNTITIKKGKKNSLQKWGQRMHVFFMSKFALLVPIGVLQKSFVCFCFCF